MFLASSTAFFVVFLMVVAGHPHHARDGESPDFWDIDDDSDRRLGSFDQRLNGPRRRASSFDYRRGRPQDVGFGDGDDNDGDVGATDDPEGHLYERPASRRSGKASFTSWRRAYDEEDHDPDDDIHHRGGGSWRAWQSGQDMPPSRRLRGGGEGPRGPRYLRQGPPRRSVDEYDRNGDDFFDRRPIDEGDDDFMLMEKRAKAKSRSQKSRRGGGENDIWVDEDAPTPKKKSKAPKEIAECGPAPSPELEEKYRQLCHLDKIRIVGAKVDPKAVETTWDQRTVNEFTHDAHHHHFWSGMSEEIYRSMVKYVADLANLPQGGRVADFGCGAGEMLHVMQETHQISFGGGIDISEQAITLARRVYPQFRFKKGNMWEFSAVRDGVMDLAVAMGTFAYLNKQQICDTLAEMFRVVKPNGVVIIYWVGEMGDKLDNEHLSKIAPRVFTGYPGEQPLEVDAVFL